MARWVISLFLMPFFWSVKRAPTLVRLEAKSTSLQRAAIRAGSSPEYWPDNARKWTDRKVNTWVRREAADLLSGGHEEEPEDGQLEDVAIQGPLSRVLEVKVVRHGGEESGADRVDPSGRPVGVLASFEEIKVECASLSSLEVDSGIRAVQSGDALGHGAEGCRHATMLDRFFTGFAGGRTPTSVLAVASTVGKEVVEAVGMHDSVEGAGDAMFCAPFCPVGEDAFFFGSGA